MRQKYLEATDEECGMLMKKQTLLKPMRRAEIDLELARNCDMQEFSDYLLAPKVQDDNTGMNRWCGIGNEIDVGCEFISEHAGCLELPPGAGPIPVHVTIEDQGTRHARLLFRAIGDAAAMAEIERWQNLYWNAWGVQKIEKEEYRAAYCAEWLGESND